MGTWELWSIFSCYQKLAFGKPELQQEAAGASRSTHKTISSRASTVEASFNFFSLRLDDCPIESSNNLPHYQPKHGLVSLTDTFTCSLALNRMLSCPLDCSSLLILLHSRFINPNLVRNQPKWDQIFSRICLVVSTSLFCSGTDPHYIFRSHRDTPQCVFGGGV